MTPRYAIRNVEGPYTGEWFTLQLLDTRDEYEEFRLTMGDPAAFEVVELDDNGEVVE